MALVQVKRYDHDDVYGVQDRDAVINTKFIRSIEPKGRYYEAEMRDGEQVTIDRNGVQRLVSAHTQEQEL